MNLIVRRPGRIQRVSSVLSFRRWPATIQTFRSKARDTPERLLVKKMP